MTILNLFRQDAFSALELTSFVERTPFLPTGLGSLNIFTDKPIRTTALAVEERNGVLVVIPTSQRGAPLTERTTEKRKMRYFETPRRRMATPSMPPSCRASASSAPRAC
ncbi:major capsid protein [Teichococcus aestuarii]